MPANVIRVKDTTKALGDLARWYRSRFDIPVIGITGSCGKTTVKEMLRVVLGEDVVASPASYNNDIGVPLTLLQMDRSTRACVVEIGTNAPGEVEYLTGIARPTVGVLTNVEAAHLEGLGTVRGVMEEKAALLRGLPADGVAIVNADNYYCREVMEDVDCHLVTFGTWEDADVYGVEPFATGNGVGFYLYDRMRFEIPALGAHNVANALAAVATGLWLNLSPDAVCNALGRYEAPPMRMSREVVGDVVLVNDAYNANPRSMEAAIRELASRPSEGRRIAVLGDMLELGDEQPGAPRGARTQGRERRTRLPVGGRPPRRGRRARGAAARDRGGERRLARVDRGGARGSALRAATRRHLVLQGLAGARAGADRRARAPDRARDERSVLGRTPRRTARLTPRAPPRDRMLYHLFHPLQKVVSGFRLFDYITFRATWAAVLAFLVATVVGPGIVASLKRRKVAGYVATGSGAVDADRRSKADVPTMGGVILLVGVALSGLPLRAPGHAVHLDRPAVVPRLRRAGCRGRRAEAAEPRLAGHGERHKLGGQVAIAFLAITRALRAGQRRGRQRLAARTAPEGESLRRAGSSTHVVEPGDTWASIAGQTFGDASRGSRVARYNGQVGRNGESPEPVPGREIRLPPPWPDPADHHRADLQVPVREVASASTWGCCSSRWGSS